MSIDLITSVLLSLTCLMIIILRSTYIKVCQSDPYLKQEEGCIERERVHSSETLEKNTNKKGFIKKVKKIFKEWISSPFFILHFCRLGIIVYLILFRSLISELLFIW
jgi:hypothetical protein